MLDSTSYPLKKNEPFVKETLGEDAMWNTFLEFPNLLVPSDDNEINESQSDNLEALIYDVPLVSGLFSSMLGHYLLSDVRVKQETSRVLSNSRLIGLYFSAHWCGPCRQFTSMLADLYGHLKEAYPTHGMEIVLVSGDVDKQNFDQYYRTMPWKAIPFDYLRQVKQSLNVTFNVHGIPFLVVLDAVSGQTVVGGNESQQEVVTACRGGDIRIKGMFESWLGRTPNSTKEIITMFELSAHDVQPKSDDKENAKIDINSCLKKNVETGASETSFNENISKRIAIEFQKLLDGGHESKSAAAAALAIVANTPKKYHQPTFSTLKSRYTGNYKAKSSDQIKEVWSSVIEMNSASAAKEVLSTALKYLINAIKHPAESKFRQIKLSNTIADSITAVEGGLTLLQSVGFDLIGTYQDFKASIPVTADLIAMEKNLLQLIEETKSD